MVISLKFKLKKKFKTFPYVPRCHYEEEFTVVFSEGGLNGGGGQGTGEVSIN